MKNQFLYLAALAIVAAPVPAAANTISASQPESIVKLLEIAGYEPKLGTDDVGDPEIEVNLDGWGASIMFYGCDSEKHDNCDAIQFIGGFDTNGSVSAEQALAISNSHRFSQITFDDEGDVWVRWDMLIGDDYPSALFLRHVRAFTGALNNAGDKVFPDE